MDIVVVRKKASRRGYLQRRCAPVEVMSSCLLRALAGNMENLPPPQPLERREKSDPTALMLNSGQTEERVTKAATPLETEAPLVASRSYVANRGIVCRRRMARPSQSRLQTLLAPTVFSLTVVGVSVGFTRVVNTLLP